MSKIFVINLLCFIFCQYPSLIIYYYNSLCFMLCQYPPSYVTRSGHGIIFDWTWQVTKNLTQIQCKFKIVGIFSWLRHGGLKVIVCVMHITDGYLKSTSSRIYATLPCFICLFVYPSLIIQNCVEIWPS